MGYFYEELGSDRFQELAQALIIAGHPNHIVQCLPTGQPDGGRDGLAFFAGAEKKNFYVFQVKFSRDPSTKEERDAVEELIKTEKDKVSRLIQKGAKQYFFITNVKGTAHLDVGSIDKVNAKLTKEFGIPTVVWWRDDLDRRVDQASDIKWSFIDICRASDLMQFLLKRQDDSKELESANAITAYIAQQYGADRDVKFKQVDLSRHLTDLFVDLPIGPKRRRDKERRGFPFRLEPAEDVGEYTLQLEHDDYFDSEHELTYRHLSQAGAFFLHMPLFKGVTRIVLEGAPGQGKSTVTQFVCQLNRLRLSEKHNELAQVTALHQTGPARVPFRVDLRDYARWVTGHHPFSKDADDQVPTEGQRSLESFLSMQVTHHAGGLKIDHQGLIEFFKRAHTVVVLDGFDEVADIATRSRVVEEICQAADRLNSLALSLQIIVTSRPAAFANSPGFPEEDWVHLELKDLRPQNIEAYRDKWSDAQDLSQDERASIVATLGEKLEQPHLRELARNPMQLAILLHLIHVQGHALPDKRTTLYEEYMKLFFNREAEKSAVVRDHRDLLLSIHGVVAWWLQTQAEEGSGAGSMTREELKACVRDYLENEEYDVSLADKLLRGTMERVGALVSRVEGTFEFEVQPIREYFTAWYLYTTAQYSPAGSPKSGTKPDRFDALARSSYWTNVTRFYCGFYDKGELSSLVDGLIELSEEDGYALVNQPRRLAMMLLGDQVFTQSPRKIKKLIAHLVEGPGFQRMTASGTGQRNLEMGLPEAAGQSALFEACVAKLDKEPEPCRRKVLRRVIAQNGPKDRLKSLWWSRFNEMRMLCDPMREAMDFGIIDAYTVSDIRRIAKDNSALLLRWLHAAGYYDELAIDKELNTSAEKEFFAGRLVFPTRYASNRRTLSPFEVLSETLSIGALTRIFAAPGGYPERMMMMSRRFGISIPDLAESLKTNERHSDGIGTFAARVVELFFEQTPDWRTQRKSWEELVDLGFQYAAGSEIIIRAALISTAVDKIFAIEEELFYDPDNEGDDEDGSSASNPVNLGDDEDGAEADDCKSDAVWADDGFKPKPGLVGQLHYARAQADNEDWWADRLDNLGEGVEQLIGVAAFCLWASPAVIAEHQATIEAALSGLNPGDWSRFAGWVNSAYRPTSRVAEPLTHDWFEEKPALEIRLSFALAKRVTSRQTDVEMRRSIGRLLFSNCCGGEDRIILREAASLELMDGGNENIDWDYVSRMSQAACRLDMATLAPLSGRQSFPVPAEAANLVLANCENHCSQWVAICEQAYQAEIAQAAPKVSGIAEADRWFTEG